MKITISREEMVKIIEDHFPIPPGFKIDEVKFSKYEDDVTVIVSQVQPRLKLDRPLFPPQRPCVVDSPPISGEDI